MDVTTTSAAPRVTADLMLRVLEHPSSVIVWLPAVDLLDVAESGLTAAQADSASIIPVVWADGAQSLLAAAGGSHAAAARAATAQLADLHARGLL